MGLLVIAVSGSVSWCLTRLASSGWPGPTAAGPASVDEVLGAALAWVGAVLTGWLALTCLVGLAASAPGAVGAAFERLAHLLTPRVARRVLSLTLGASVGTVALPAPVAVATSVINVVDASSRQHAVPAPPPGYSVTSEGGNGGTTDDEVEPVPAAPRPGWLPDRPTPAIRPLTARLLAPALRPTSTTSDTVTVRRGDTLWSIAAAHLGSGATDAAVASEWPRWYEANRALIGDDPDVIVPGLQLRAPVAEVLR